MSEPRADQRPQAASTTVEICVDDIDGALTAERAGADRVELCAALGEGGITPSLGMTGRVLDRVQAVDVAVMIRPRGGDFIYSPDEVAVMLDDIAAISALPRHPGVGLGFVVGALTVGDEVDVAVTSRLVSACAPAPVTFHRAFDMTRDLPGSILALLDLGIARVLTSGGARTAAEGAPVLKRLVGAAAGRLAVMAGGSVRADNALGLVTATGVPAIHLRAMAPVPAARPYDLGAPRPGHEPDRAAYTRLTTSYDGVSDVLRALGRI